MVAVICNDMVDALHALVEAAVTCSGKMAEKSTLEGVVTYNNTVGNLHALAEETCMMAASSV